MGKSKQRIIAKAKNEKSLLKISRNDAIQKVCNELNKSPVSLDAKNLISLFGLTAEELSEAGLCYEILRSLDGLI